MRFLADEGVDGTIVGSIRGNGHDVCWMVDRSITIPTKTIVCRRSYEAALIALTPPPS